MANNQSVLLLTDSVLKLNLNNKILAVLNCFKIFTVSDLLKQAPIFKNNESYYSDIINSLSEYGLKIDINLSNMERCQRNKQREKILLEQENIRNKYNINEFFNLNISSINFPKNILKQLRNIDINTISDLLQFNMIELVLSGKLSKDIVIKIDEELSKYGLSMNDNIDESKTHDEDDVLLDGFISRNSKIMADDDEIWWEYFNALTHFYAENKHIIVLYGTKFDDLRLGAWLIKQRKNYKQGLLSQTAIDALEEMDIIWDVSSKDGKHKKGYIMASLGIDSMSVVDGKQVSVMVEDLNSSITSINGLKQFIKKLNDETLKLESEIQEKQELIKQIEFFQARQEELQAESHRLGDKLAALIDGNNSNCIDNRNKSNCLKKNHL